MVSLCSLTLYPSILFVAALFLLFYAPCIYASNASSATTTFPLPISPASIGTIAVSVAQLDQGLCFGLPPPIPVAELSIADVHAAFLNKTLTCSQLVRSYIQRIENFDQKTGLNAIRAVIGDAMEEAAALDAQLELFVAGGTGNNTLPPLFCIPLLIKDNIDISGLPTTAGSVALIHNYPLEDAHIVGKLRSAGALILAKTNMGELAFFPSFCTSSLGGTVLNPWHLGRAPAGSSGGSAAGISAGFGVAALGTDTGNSVRGPASHTALVGLRPSLGLVGRSGVVPLRFDRDTVGPLTKSVRDAAVMLTAMIGYDEKDNLTHGVFKQLDPPTGVELTTTNSTNFESLVPPARIDYAALLDSPGATSLSNITIGVFTQIAKIPGSLSAITFLFNKAIADLAEGGATIVEDFRIRGNNLGRDWDANRDGEGPALGHWNVNGSWQDLWACQSPLRVGFDEYIQSSSSNAIVDILGNNSDTSMPIPTAPVPKSLQELFESGLYHPAAAGDLRAAVFAPYTPDDGPMPILSLSFIGNGTGRGICKCGILEQDPCRSEFRDRLIESMDAAGVDVIVYPTWNRAPLPVSATGDGYYDGNNSPMIAPHVGSPAITVPMGFIDEGLPAGLQMLARPFDEERLLRVAFAYEQLTKHRKGPPPIFKECGGGDGGLAGVSAG